MPDNIFNISPLNPIKFYQQSTIENIADDTFFGLTSLNGFDAKYNHRHIDMDFYLPNLKSWQDGSCYLQPFQTTDTIYLQWIGINGSSGTYVVNLLDLNGNVCYSFNAVNRGVIGSSTNYVWDIDVPLMGVAENKYSVQICLFTSFKQKVISEPIEVKAKHEDTMLFEYSSNVNYQGIFFDLATKAKFQIRLYCALSELNTASKTFGFEDENYNLTTMSNVPYRNWSLHFGIEGHGIPEFIADKLERILGCEILAIDGKYFSRIEGSKLDAVRVPNTVVMQYKIELREKINDASLYTSTQQNINLGTLKTIGKFFICQFSNGTTTKTINRWFNNTNEFCSYLIDKYGGIFFIDENFNLMLQAKDSTQYTAFNNYALINTLLYCLEFTYEVGADSNQFLTLDNQTIAAYKVNYAWLKSTQFTTTPVIQNSYSEELPIIGAITKETTYLLFTDANIEFIFNSFTSPNRVKSIGGFLPKNLYTLEFPGNNLKYINNNIFLHCGGNLALIELSGNILSSNQVDNIIMNIKDTTLLNANFTTNCVVSLNQSPAAPTTNSISFNQLINSLSGSFLIYHD